MFSDCGNDSMQACLSLTDDNLSNSRAFQINCAQFKTVKPVGDRVLVKVDKEEAKSIGGVLLPAVARNKPTAGAVIALGEASTVKVRYNAALSHSVHYVSGPLKRVCVS